MPKTMARIKDGVVSNLVWVDDSILETSELKNTYNLPVEIGDVYDGTAFYNNGIKRLSHRKQMQNLLSSYNTELTEIAKLLDVSPTTLEEQESAILSRLADMREALDTMEVVPSE